MKLDFKVAENKHDYRAVHRYLELFKMFVVCGGNELRKKFRQMLHGVDYIQRHRYPINYDGSRGENIGKTKIKDNAKRIHYQKPLYYGISRRILEDDVVDCIPTSFLKSKCYWLFKFCSQRFLMTKYNHDIVVIFAEIDPSSHHRFTITCDYS